MNFTSMLRSSLVFGAMLLSLFSCNYILENNKDEIDKINKEQHRINTNKEEAKLLVQVSKNNIAILELSEIIKDFETDKHIKVLAESLEKTHFEISKNYNDLAREKLISIPNYTNVNYDIELKEVTNEPYIESNLKLILTKIMKQIRLLDTLSQITNNVEFKILAVRDNYLLKRNANKIEITLSRLNEPI